MVLTIEYTDFDNITSASFLIKIEFNLQAILHSTNLHAIGPI